MKEMRISSQTFEKISQRAPKRVAPKRAAPNRVAPNRVRPTVCAQLCAPKRGVPLWNELK